MYGHIFSRRCKLLPSLQIYSKSLLETGLLPQKEAGSVPFTTIFQGQTAVSF